MDKPLSFCLFLHSATGHFLCDTNLQFLQTFHRVCAHFCILTNRGDNPGNTKHFRSYKPPTLKRREIGFAHCFSRFLFQFQIDKSIITTNWHMRLQNRVAAIVYPVKSELWSSPEKCSHAMSLNPSRGVHSRWRISTIVCNGMCTTSFAISTRWLFRAITFQGVTTSLCFGYSHC